MLGVVPAASQRLDSADALPPDRHPHPETQVSRPPILAARRNVHTVSLVTLLPLVLIVGVMFMMTRSAKNKQRQAQQMRSEMDPGTGVRTIGGLYAVVKEVNDETVLLELTDGVHAHFAKNAIGAVLSEEEFNRIVHGIEPEELGDDLAEGAEPAEDAEDAVDTADVDSAAENVELTKDTKDAKEPADADARIDLGKPGAPSEQDGSGSK
jgi:preprotein translocase subunit YajC